MRSNVICILLAGTKNVDEPCTGVGRLVLVLVRPIMGSADMLQENFEI